MSLTSLATLRKALREGDEATVQKCVDIGHQNLDTYVYNEETQDRLTLLFDAVVREDEESVFTLLKFKNLINLNEVVMTPNYSCNALHASRENPRITLALIEAGISLEVDEEDLDFTHPFQSHTLYSGRLESAFMLLAAGMEPKFSSYASEETIGALMEKATEWLESLVTAKREFFNMLENEMLAQEICDFVYNEENLLNVLRQIAYPDSDSL